MFEVRVVVIAPEGVNGEEFGEFLDDLEVRGRLDRVVIDECHCVLDVFDGWRVGMLNLREMVKREIGVLFLTGTLPERSVGRWLEVMDLRRNDLVVVRDETVRPELRYGVMEWGSRVERDGKLEGLVRRGREKFGKGGKVLVFGGSVKVCEELGKKYGWLVYHADVGSDGEKKRILEKWMSGDCDVIVGTTALGMGVNCLGCRMVIHMRMSWGFVEYCQESGRCGRDGRLGECWVLKGRFEKLNWKKVGQEELVEGERFLSGDVCLRSVIDGVIDGSVRKNGCLDGKEELCSVCWKLRGGNDVMEREGLIENCVEMVDGDEDGLEMVGDDGVGVDVMGDDGNYGDGVDVMGDDENVVGDDGNDGEGRDGVEGDENVVEDGEDMVENDENVVEDDGNGEEIGLEMMGNDEIGMGMVGDDEVGVGMVEDGEIGVGMMGSGEVYFGGSSDGKGGWIDGGSDDEESDDEESDDEESDDEESDSDGESDEQNRNGHGRGKRKVGEMDVNQMVRDVREGQRRVRMRLEEVEMGGRTRKERRKRLFGELVERILKGGCILCFWMKNREGWNDEEKHRWEDCRFFGKEGVDYLMGMVKEVEKIGKDWSERRNSGCNLCWLPKCVCDGWVENEKGSWVSRRKQDRKVECGVRGIDVVGLGVLMINVRWGGEEGTNEDLDDWLKVRARVSEKREGKKNNEVVYEWMRKRQLWCLRELNERSGGEDEDEDGYYDFNGTDEGNRGWRDGIETNGLCCLLWKCRNVLWEGLREMEGMKEMEEGDGWEF